MWTFLGITLAFVAASAVSFWLVFSYHAEDARNGRKLYADYVAGNPDRVRDLAPIMLQLETEGGALLDIMQAGSCYVLLVSHLGRSPRLVTVIEGEG